MEKQKVLDSSMTPEYRLLVSKVKTIISGTDSWESYIAYRSRLYLSSFSLLKNVKIVLHDYLESFHKHRACPGHFKLNIEQHT